MAQRVRGPYRVEGLTREQFTDQTVREAISRVPRHRFVPKDVAELAYDDRALPIGFKQTISQPFIVALMTQEAEVKPGAKILEVGTGSGYQAAVLAELGCEVFSVEIVPELAETAKRRLESLGYDRVAVRQGDGWNGWPEAGPFDAIIVTASSPGFPPRLLEQLAPGGRLVIPVEQPGDQGETLMVVRREGEDFVTRNLGGVKFVPLTGEARIITEEPPNAPQATGGQNPDTQGFEVQKTAPALDDEE